MGVNIFLLDRRTVTLVVGGARVSIGTLRRFFKITELDEERAAELATASAAGRSPLAVMLADISELALATEPDKPVAAHLVLGWDEGRGSVTDFGWDYLPKIGYAVRDPAGEAYLLYEERSGLLHPIDAGRAQELRLLDPAGRLIRHGQPHIVNCRSVKRWTKDYAEAECTFENGEKNTVLTLIPDGQLPPETWFIGKRPMDVERYSSQ